VNPGEKVFRIFLLLIIWLIGGSIAGAAAGMVIAELTRYISDKWIELYELPIARLFPRWIASLGVDVRTAMWWVDERVPADFASLVSS